MLFRIGVTTDLDGTLLGASFVALRNDQPEAEWPIPLAEAKPLIVLLNDARPEGTELPPPPVGDHPNDEEVRGGGTSSTSDEV